MAAFAYYEDKPGSICAPYQLGHELALDARKGYEELYEHFQVPKNCRYVFTSSGADAICQMVYSVVQQVVKKEGKNHFVARSLDEAPIILSCEALEEEACRLTLAQASDKGFMTSEALLEAISPRTALISCSLACALTGVMQPIEEIAAIAKQRGILFHLDVSHCIGKLPISFDELGCDYLTFNAEQFHGLSGTGGLFIKDTAPYTSFTKGQMLSLPLFRSLVEAVRGAKEDELVVCTEVARLRARLEEGLVSQCGDVVVLFENEERLPHISCMSFLGVKSDALCFALSRKNVYASMGGGALQHIQKVLEASGIPKPASQCALTFSLSKDTQEKDVDRAIIIISECVQRLRKTSKMYFTL